MKAPKPSKRADLRKSKAQLIEELERWRSPRKEEDSPSRSSAQGFSSAQLLGILQVADDAIISMDEHYRIIMFNQGAESIFGFTSREVLGKPIDVLLPEGVRAIHRRQVEELTCPRLLYHFVC